jgi:ribonuclease P protein component
MDTLKKRSEFLAVAKGGRLGRRAFVVQGLARDTDEAPRVGYTVTKKTGNSVMRSRIKRRLRAAVAELHAGDIPQKADFVLVARDSALTLPFQKLVADLKSGLNKVLDPETPRGRGKPRRGNRSSQATPRRKQG